MTLASGEGTVATADGAEVFYRIVGEGPPALIVAGRHDPYCTLDQAEELAALLVLDRAAYAISADGGVAVEQAVDAFLTRHNPGAIVRSSTC